MNNNNFSKKFANTSLLMGLGIVALLLIIFWFSGVFGIINSVIGPIGIVALLAFIAFTLGSIYFTQRWILGGLKSKGIPNGLPATATVIKSYQAGMSMKAGANQFYSVIIEVNVSNPQGETWQAKIEQMLPVTQVSVFQPGVQFAVKYDPKDSANICFDRNS